MSYENDAFRKAARDAGIRGKSLRKGDDALDDFSTYYHNQWQKWDREQDGYDGVHRKAQAWWSSNSGKYS